MNTNVPRIEDSVRSPAWGRSWRNLPHTSKKAASKLFVKLKLKQEANVFESPNFKKWEKSVAKSFAKTPEAASAAMVTTLVGHYGEETLAKMLVDAKSYRTRKVADTLEEALLKSGRLTERQRTISWVSYVKMHGDDPYEMLFLQLKAQYTDNAALASLLVKGNNAVANRLMEVQLNEWMKQDQSVESIFNLLKLDQAGDKLFEYPTTSTWAWYARKVDKHNPDESMLATLKQHYIS
ncbi:unnamed protein product [Phytophthora fragariaefolia]|uniref:Unnamed protein product n=1 Tax=Phytophthora fragariaefolia TaxID=1490495 RepID=A0A9W6YE10_9STRA|nr:unnamed protein product [Phytophthora fragariaefolia]